MSLMPIPILAFDQNGGLKTNKKPRLIPENAFQRLENAFVYRDRTIKREGLELVGRLSRELTAASLGNSGASPWSFNIYSTLAAPITGEPNAAIEVGSVTIVIGGVITFTDDGDGTLSSVTPGNSGIINYATGDVTLTHTAGAGVATTITFTYSPSLPVMGIQIREIAGINDEQTIFFDTKYAYVWTGTEFTEFITGTTWSGTNSDFFWTTNYRGAAASTRLFFATNFVVNAANAIRYTDGATWTSFAPLISATDTLYQARILIPYYGRLIALNTYEGTTAGGYAGATNFFNRCRFSQVGSPIDAAAWRQDQFGRGGFVDAPTNEQIIGATFLNNTLIVFFERTTWQLRYVGEYGLPFIWERIASDLGSESTFSPVLFSDSVLAIGDKAIINSNAIGVERIDLDIPDEIFNFQNLNEGVKRVQGVRDYRRELVFWCYPDAQTQAAAGVATTYPNRVLVYNYRNRTWAIFRDNVTAFGTLQDPDDITWDSQEVNWDDEDITWDDVGLQSRFPFIVSGNQQGFIHKYGYTFPDQSSLEITGIAEVSNTLRLTIPSHNLAIGETIRISGMLFLTGSTPTATDLNDKLYYVIDVIDVNTITIAKWNFQLQGYETNFSYTPDLGTADYVGGGLVAYFPKPNIQTKDFNPFQQQGIQTKLSYIDFLMSQQDQPEPRNISGATQANPCVITSIGHGLQSGQNITISGVNGMTQLNVGAYYTVTVLTADTFSIGINSTNYSAYTSGGSWRLLTANASVQIFINSSPAIYGNLLVGNNGLSTQSTAPFYGPASDYAWYRLYATTTGQFFNVLVTYDDNLMNTDMIHDQNLELHAFTLYCRPGSRRVF